jgi:hypothetical protein
LNPLELPPLAALRRNHALEHATLHVLSERNPGLRLMGSSDWSGFTLYGAADLEHVADALMAALERLQAGESALAVHPRCGTNVAAGVTLVGLASYAALSNRRTAWWRKALRLALGLGAALSIAPSLGLKLQEHVTTSAEASSLRVTGIHRRQVGAVVLHRITTRQE